MSLAERVRNAEPRNAQPGPACNVQKALASLDQEDADALIELLYRRRDLTSTEVTDLLDDEGIDTISSDTVRRHRLGRCRTCKRKGKPCPSPSV